MFDFYYNKMTKNCPCEFELGMSDTDSLLVKVTKPKEFWRHIDPFMDYSNYPPSHPKFSADNKAKLGYFKDELCGNTKCLGFVGLRPKCYALSLKDKSSKKLSEKKVCKGLGRTAIKNRLKYDQYLHCLKNKKPVRHSYASIRSKKHNLMTILQKKKALTHFDSKRWLFNCGIHSSPYGSKLIEIFSNTCPFCK